MATSRQNSARNARGERRGVGVLIALLGLTTAGCLGRGTLYTRTVEPYSEDFHNTPVGTKTCRVDEHILREPFTRADVSVSFTSRVVSEAAQKAGMTNIYYADLETFSVMKGVYEKRTLILSGD